MEKRNMGNSNPFVNIMNLSKKKCLFQEKGIHESGDIKRKDEFTPKKRIDKRNRTPIKIEHICLSHKHNCYKNSKKKQNVSMCVNKLDVNKNGNVNNIVQRLVNNNNVKEEIDEIQKLKKLIEEKEKELQHVNKQINELCKENIALKAKVGKYKERLENMANDVNHMSKETLSLNEEMFLQGNVIPNLDEMTYEELLALEDKIGYVSKGLKKEIIKKLPRKEYIKTNQDNCVICQSDINQGDIVIELKCGHLYHCACIEEWLLKEKICPFCKAEVFIEESA